MSSKIKKLFFKYKEIILYLIFGVLTTVVGYCAYHIVIRLFIEQFHNENGEPLVWLTSAANVADWVCGVLFAFFTNRKYVFTDSEKKPMGRQFISFAASRVITLLLSLAIVPSLQWLLETLSYQPIFGVKANTVAKLVSMVVVVILNYVFSKIFVFKKKAPSKENGRE